MLRTWLPKENTLPEKWPVMKKMLTDLGMKAKRIDACENNCILHYGTKKNLMIMDEECYDGCVLRKTEEGREDSEKTGKVTSAGNVLLAFFKYTVWIQLLMRYAREKFLSLRKGTKMDIATMLEEKFLESVSGTMDAYLRYFKQGYELLHQMEPYINQPWFLKSHFCSAMDLETTFVNGNGTRSVDNCNHNGWSKWATQNRPSVWKLVKRLL
ncbi:hypothetical protein IFM89_016464 [Coptis chinensis]|uniref:Uncharacterized protein n=1 Tax=Coptis chinensis TaxID=261450 RepID=A0A835I0I2_9MAGN|nr:hypothetical protein IFM89_016464 [Coptis chinensis]